MTVTNEIDAPPIPRLKQKYREEIIPAPEEFGYTNIMQVPGLTKIVNMGVGDAARTLSHPGCDR